MTMARDDRTLSADPSGLKTSFRSLHTQGLRPGRLVRGLVGAGRIRTVVVVIAAVLCLSGCNILPKPGPKITPPAARVGAVKLLNQTHEGAVVMVSVELENPNRTALPLLNNRYTLTVGGLSFNYTDQPLRTLPSKGVQTLDLKAALSTGGRDLRGAAFRVTGRVDYEPPSQIRRLLTESGVPLPNVAYAGYGVLE